MFLRYFSVILLILSFANITLGSVLAPFSQSVVSEVNEKLHQAEVARAGTASENSIPSHALRHSHDDPFQEQEKDCSDQSQNCHHCHFGHCLYTLCDIARVQVSEEVQQYAIPAGSFYLSVVLDHHTEPPSA